MAKHKILAKLVFVANVLISLATSALTAIFAKNYDPSVLQELADILSHLKELF